MKKFMLCLLVLLISSACSTTLPASPAVSPVVASPSPTPMPQRVLDTSVPLKESEAVDDSYFDDVVFVGDSRTVGIFEFEILPNTTVFASLSLNVNDLSIKKVIGQGDKKQTVMEALEGGDYHAIYICFGFNELGYNYPEIFIKRYEKAIDQIQALHPNTPIVVSLLFHISKKHEEKQVEYENNERIDEYNTLILEMAKRRKLPVLNIGEALEDEEGYLISDYTDDGTHINERGYSHWLHYIKTHTLEGNLT